MAKAAGAAESEGQMTGKTAFKPKAPAKPEPPDSPAPPADAPPAPEAAGDLPPRLIESNDGLEASTIFPATPTSDFRSPYWRDSYNFPWNPDPLCRSNNYSIYDEMRDDDQVKVCLSLKKDTVVNSGWDIECEDEDVKDFLVKNLEEMQDRASVDSSFEDALRDIKSDYDYGFSVSEVLSELKDGQYWIKAIKTRAPHTWKFNMDDKGNLKELLQNTATGEKPLNPKFFIHSVYQPEFGNPYGKSDLRAAHTAWKAKKFVLRMYAIYLERFAGPTVIARYKPGTQDDEINRIHEMVKTIQNSTGMTFPDDVTVDFVQAARDASDAYERAIHLFNLAMARAILVPDLLGVAGDKTSGGSFALGEKHFDLFSGTVQKDRKTLERKVNLRIIRPLVEVNFGKDVEAKWILKPWAKDDKNEYLKMWIEAVKGSVYKPGSRGNRPFPRVHQVPETAAGNRPAAGRSAWTRAGTTWWPGRRQPRRKRRQQAPGQKSPTGGKARNTAGRARAGHPSAQRPGESRRASCSGSRQA
jgi:hypothetical protein